MSRPVPAAGLVLALAAVLAALLLGSGPAPSGAAEGEDTLGRVDAIFDTAKGIVPGQVVKVAGARVGEVVDVKLTDDYRARLELEVDPRFTPFRTDASCEIQPEGLISENFVQCDPGSAQSPELRGAGELPPTVALARTSVPVNLTDLFEIWEAPVRDRLRLLLNSLGAGMAGRGEDLSEVLRRANPTLGLVREVVEIADDQRAELTDAIVQTETVGRELARRPERLEAFVAEGADVLSITGRRRAELRAGVRKLPATLAAARPTLIELERFAEQGAPLARRLAVAAPRIDDLLKTIPPASAAALPALRALGTTASRARPTVRSARPIVGQLRRFAAAALPTGDALEKTLTSLRDRGFVENLGLFIYFGTSALSRYDTVSHILPAQANLTECMQFATTTIPQCDANYVRTPPTGVANAPGARKGAAARAPSSARVPKPAAAPIAPALPSVRPGGRPVLPEGDVPAPPAVDRLLDYLLG